MKRTILAFGLIITLIGIGIVPYYNQARIFTEDKVIRYNTNQWTLSCNLEKGDNVTVVFRQHWNWTYGYFDIGDNSEAVMYLFIDITDPNGNITSFDVQLTLIEAGQTGYRRLVISGIDALTNGSIDTHSMLDEKGLPMYVGGTIPSTGEYTASVEVYPSRVDQPPSYLAFSHNVTSTKYPNSYLLPVGAAITIAGGTVSIFGLKSGTYRKNVKHRISYKSRKQ